MENENNRNTFVYAYSARKHEESDEIRQKRSYHRETKLERLRRLYESATRFGTIVSLTVGIVGMLLLSFGIFCAMVIMKGVLLLGVLISASGIVCLLSAYPLSIYITKKKREKLAPEILKLTEESIQKK